MLARLSRWENLWALDLHFLHGEILLISHPFQYSFLCAWWKVKNAIENPMAFGTGKGCWYFTSAPFILPVFDFLTSHRVPCLWKHWFYWTISCFLIRRRGNAVPYFHRLLPPCCPYPWAGFLLSYLSKGIFQQNWFSADWSSSRLIFQLPHITALR